MKTALHSPVLKNFASPLHCLYLKEAGLDVTTTYFWKIRGIDALLCTYYFDIDNYYRQAFANLEAIHPLTRKLPAFEIVDLQMILPDYSMDRHRCAFHINVEGLPAIVEERLPDAFATAVLECFRAGIVTSEMAAVKIFS